MAATLKPYVGFQDDLFPGNVSRGWLRDFHLPPHEDTFVYWAWGEEGEVGRSTTAREGGGGLRAASVPSPHADQDADLLLSFLTRALTPPTFDPKTVTTGQLSVHGCLDHPPGL